MACSVSQITTPLLLLVQASRSLSLTAGFLFQLLAQIFPSGVLYLVLTVTEDSSLATLEM